MNEKKKRKLQLKIDKEKITQLYKLKLYQLDLNIKTVLSGDIIELTRKVFYGEYVGENDTATKIVMYKDASKQRKIGELPLKNGMINQSEIIAKYSSKINTYIYTFQLRKGSDYSFVKIEKGR